MNFPGGFAIAITAPWGFGKSTLLNFLVQYLQEKPEDEKPIVVTFNPWLFQAFFDVSDRLLNSEAEPEGIFDLGIDMRVERIIAQLLRRLNEQEQFETLKNAMSNSNSLSTQKIVDRNQDLVNLVEQFRN
ncbi:KAP P-loop domain-containing protein [Calothrix sp. NIES-2100]|nr:KAP P-loop domain-containing protein [Calothrix sp. NIES-2100]